MEKSKTRLIALERHLLRIDRHINAFSRASQHYSWLRMVIFLTGAIVTIAAFRFLGTSVGLFSLVFSTALFSVAVHSHRRIKAVITQFQLWRVIKASHIARIKLDWKHIPPIYTLPPSPNHPFESDLDLVGEHSILRLIDTSVSIDGSKRLHEWLSRAEPDLQTIVQRQALIRELAVMPYFRDRLTLNGYLTARQFGQQLDSTSLAHWLVQESSGSSLRSTLLTAAALAVVNIVLFLLFQRGITPPLWVISFAAYWIVSLSQFKHIGSLLENSQILGDLMDNLHSVFFFLERYPFKQNSLIKITCKPFQNADNRPTHHLRRVTRAISAASLQRTQLLWLLINSVIPWDLFFAYRLEILKADLKVDLPGWLDVWFELEALSSLANLAHLNPDYVFPILTNDGHHTSVFNAVALGHPLLPSDVRKTNDFSISALRHIAIVTGSNMSGKSSFLRTLGVNLCLANAGAPVCAQLFESQIFRVFTCIKVSDSVTDGISYFYAEVRRLKALLNALEEKDQPPIFFLIDEIFRGTNNRERLIGSQAFIRSLLNQRGVGVVSTHDLELVALGIGNSKIANYHFEEIITQGEMVFDYHLHPGPSQTTNALKIMEIEGLPVNGV